MVLERFATYILAQKFTNIPSFIVKNGPEKWTPKRAKNVFFFYLLLFPRTRAKNVVSTRESGQQTGLKAYLYVYIWLMLGSAQHTSL